jgi:hypothetical protein
MKITCLHTAQSHVEEFSALFAKENWEGALDHIVHSDLLARVQTGGPDAVSDDLNDILKGCEEADAVLCTCSTLGGLLEDLAGEKVVRIDRPAMEQAAGFGKVMLAICLESTRLPSTALFEACAKGKTPHVVFCAEAWPHFEAGEMPAFQRSIAQSVGAAMIDVPETDCIVLAQASMQGAAPLLMDIGVPVLTTPSLAVRRAIKIARR